MTAPPHGIQVPTTPTGPSGPTLPSSTTPPVVPHAGTPSLPSDETGPLPPHGIAVPTNSEGPTGPATTSNTNPPDVPANTPPTIGVGHPGTPNTGPPPTHHGGGGAGACGAGSTPLTGMTFVNALIAECDLYFIDPLAVAANALNEGLGGGIGDGGNAYGPWQDHLTEFAGRPWYGCGKYTATVNQWAWSADGITYSIKQMNSGGAHGLVGHAAVYAIVYGYEKPLDKPGAVAARDATYDQLKAMGAGWKKYVADHAHGPSGLVVPSPVPVVAPSQETKPSTAFHDCMKWLAADVPARATTLQGLGSTLTPAVASQLWSPST